jgi:hypothetical protein
VLADAVRHMLRLDADLRSYSNSSPQAPTSRWWRSSASRGGALLRRLVTYRHSLETGAESR